MKLMYNSRWLPYIGPLYVYLAPDLWIVKQVNLLSGGMRVVKIKDRNNPSPVNHEGGGDNWTIIDKDHDRMGLMKSGSIAMGAVCNLDTGTFIEGVLAMAGMMGKRTWTEPSIVSTQFSRPYVTNGQYGYVVKRQKTNVEIELKHNVRVRPLTTPTITLSKGGHLLVPMPIIKARLEASYGALCDPFAFQKHPKTGEEYVVL